MSENTITLTPPSGGRGAHVCLTPALLPLFNVEDYIVVVIDIFRATSSICYGIENGAEAIIPVSQVEECAAYREKGLDYLLAAERDGSVVDGFDFGNSPFSYTKEKVAGKTIVLTTTNGTHALHLSRSAKKIVIGSFLNLTALSNWLNTQNENVLLVCAGWKNNFNLEDTLFAGAVIEQLEDKGFLLDDAALAANDLFQVGKNDINGYLKKTSHGERLKKLGIEKDIEFCLQVDLTTAIPVLEGEKLVKLAVY
ncbi:2-phosphosulfolactate phosphatase [Mucilaginibacter rubeus]|uniref:Probable 2-phosphosulfolactate phosphatase n=1 Tax=Mucilaginibacter rubeus TaxID=2027860 RepID=A0AAE6ML93_9SPHI|nr:MULTISPECIES: 2-phosphosulfolactate phosphatase [Mucilaginibacter]QEM07550.1 2-phosphosulfolactate phosphatase [Mucilaginibacter rubeus]QEM20004.1 2-phosphosulfolactate phosphatase [Mucilaginibacter gossypii]QTE43285.1 2-phosphosulfolactate phosphatase [Mucilaginibacter rubeus]QTE49885.1 2-phosphosulfolactate phosphatase [Mucilaginibacter rubeus]QTE54976.1 2-phosphosulfolactate phosphatase [Mucilaginibacter rubeus]